jgi:hypothetical protein
MVRRNGRFMDGKGEGTDDTNMRFAFLPVGGGVLGRSGINGFSSLGVGNAHRSGGSTLGGGTPLCVPGRPLKKRLPVSGIFPLLP